MFFFLDANECRLVDIIWQTFTWTLSINHYHMVDRRRWCMDIFCCFVEYGSLTPHDTIFYFALCLSARSSVEMRFCFISRYALKFIWLSFVCIFTVYWFDSTSKPFTFCNEKCISVNPALIFVNLTHPYRCCARFQSPILQYKSITFTLNHSSTARYI